MNRKVVFMMAFYGRPALTRMSMSHMARVIKMFNDAGHEATGFVIGDDKPEGKYAEKLGLDWIDFPNKPLNKKMSKMFRYAATRPADYVCWFGSNNLHSDKYIKECISLLSEEDPLDSWASETFVMTHKDHNNTCVFRKPEKDFAVCSSMQFYNTRKLLSYLDLVHWPDDFERGFDADINWLFGSRDRVKKIYIDGLEAIDIKGDGDMNDFDRYAVDGKDLYEKGPTKKSVIKKFPEYQELENGYFCRNKKK